jgi:hypothetical protein
MVLPLGDVEKTRIVPVVTYLLILVNIVMFCVELDQGKTFQASYSATPYEITHAEDIVQPVPVLLEGDRVKGEPMIEHGPIPFSVYLTLITSMFLHLNPLHLAFSLDLWRQCRGSLRLFSLFPGLSHLRPGRNPGADRDHARFAHPDPGSFRSHRRSHGSVPDLVSL